MRTFRKVFPFGLSIALLLSAADPPADVDAALRSRVQEFYQLQVDKKYRQAEQLVAEDTKDFYYSSQKPDLRVFKIGEIVYASDFQTAKVPISIQKQVLVPGAGPIQMNFSGTTYWKIENGKWCWYVDRVNPVDTPFGQVAPGSASKHDATGSPIPTLTDPASAIAMMNGVHADPERLHLDPNNFKPQIVTLRNTLPGPVTIQSLTSSPSMSIVITKPNLGAQESTEVTITPVAGSSERPTQLLFKVGPIGQTIRIDLDFSPK